MAITTKSQAEKFYSRMQSAYLRLSDKFATKDQIDHLGALITEYGKNIGGGDNKDWRELYPGYQPIRSQILLLRMNPPKILGFDNFIKNLDSVIVAAWALQLLSPPSSDQILKQIWELCGEIADKFEADIPAL